MQFDVLKIGDFRFPGGTSTAIAHEIRALAEAGYSVGLLQKDAAILKAARTIHPQIQACIDDGMATLVTALAPGERLQARLVLLHGPYSFLEDDPKLPGVEADHRIIVAHHAASDRFGLPYYDPAVVQANAEKLVGPGVVWAPISPVSRANFQSTAPQLTLHPDDWWSPIFLADWACQRQPLVGRKPVIGRHGRPSLSKWPASREEILLTLPERDDIDVRILGGFDALKALMGGAYPKNWTVLPFNAVPPADFLPTIDFFVYYHHPDLIESLGRTVMEAVASGTIAILPEHFRLTFGEAALYREPHQVEATVRALAADEEEYHLRSRLGQRALDRTYGPKRYIERVRGILDAPVEAARPAGPQRIKVDILTLADFRTMRETAARIVNETRIQHAQGYSTGLLHQPSAAGELTHIHPDIDRLVTDGEAVAVPPTADRVEARLLVVHQPEVVLDRMLSGEAGHLPRIEAQRTVVILDRSVAVPEIRRKDAVLRGMFGHRLTWAATRLALKKSLSDAGVAQESDLWTMSIMVHPWQAIRRRRRDVPVVGRMSLVDRSQWLERADQNVQAFPGSDQALVRIMGLPSARRLPFEPVPDGWQLFGLDDMNTERFLSGLDVFSYFPGEQPTEVPGYALAWAMAHGAIAILPPALEPMFGRGAILYAGATRAAQTIREHFADTAKFDRVSTDCARYARETWGPQIHVARLNRLAGRPDQVPAPAVQASPRKRVIFMSTNGVGMGHLARLAAIARRMPQSVEPVFFTLSQALDIVRQLGYPAEYLPYHAYSNGEVSAWNHWAAEQITQTLDFHRARALVFDGGHPYQGLVDAIAPRPDTRFVWVRRGMWRETQNNAEAIRRGRYFDLVIEPSDIAESADKGATATSRQGTAKVDPIRLLDEDELMSREEAAAFLGLDPKRPAALIQLGSGSNRDIVSMIDLVLRVLHQHPEVQPVLAEWVISPSQLDFWPGLKRLRGFPISRYFNAFDFTISAAGYNSFNEIVSFGLPAVFLANEHAAMDDQGGRALYAESNGAAFYLPENQPEEIGPMIEVLLDPAARQVLRANCLRIARPNGAGQAAQLIASTL